MYYLKVVICEIMSHAPSWLGHQHTLMLVKHEGVYSKYSNFQLATHTILPNLNLLCSDIVRKKLILHW